MRFLPVFSFACILLLQVAPKALAFESRFSKKIDLDVLEADMMENEEPDDNAAFKMERGEDGKLHPTGEELAPKPEMLFVELKAEYDTKEKAEEVAEKWTGLLFTNGLQVRPYPIDDNRLLFVVNTGMFDTEEFKSFALDQEETEVVEYKQQKYYPGDEKKKGGGVDMKKINEILAKQGISLGGGNAPVGRKKKKQRKTKRQKREEKRKRKEAKQRAKQKDAKDDL
mmetsp:Transcript_5954/g.8181  ORF Transcript_5954/g.8181 Transcript_5954/m.8181 type:complete len:226 (-) Transcript_5954:167-844(-)|eukprot:CAMPEP_0185264344 /NCGR_PEP_ID=MMETSP1359-20130426/22278_1 /TAXON_ID=552665 /ORGANISM="Bigelowiella longifila, Strain CCMP242" /LENGTH=225 /DNA_ID=CAMNT_0027852853 /DNA_START=142 /DNA_END=819 /DNA_ORIENTATION=-